MDKVVLVVQVVFWAGSADIAVFVNIDSKIFCDYGPDAQIKFSFFVQKRFFNVLLNNPKCLFLLLFENKLDNVAKLFENLNASTLVESGWLHNPHIGLAVFLRDLLVTATTICYFSEAVHEQLNITIVGAAWNHEGGRGGVEESVVVLLSLFMAAVVGLERLYEIGLGANSSDDFEVVENEGRAFYA